MGLVIGSCVGSDGPTGVDGGSALVGLTLQPALIPSPADAGALPVNRIRAVVARQPDDAVLRDARFDVLATDTAWTININVPVTGSTTEVVVSLYLLNVESGGSEAVQFSGRTGALSIAPGVRLSEVDVDLVRGPLDNLSVTAVTITSFPDTLGVEKSATLSASATATAGSTPAVFWTSLDPGLLTLAGSVATGASPGTARVIASAGAYADTVSIEVIVVPVDSVRVSPDSADVSVSATRTYSVQILDADGVALTGRSVTWSTGNPSVATVDQAGVVTGVAPGTTTVTATSESVSDDAKVVVLSGGGGPAGQNTWIATGGNWSTPANWNLGRVPIPGDTVFLTQGDDYMVTLDTDVTVARLDIGGTTDVITLAVGDFALTLTDPGPTPTLSILPFGGVEVQNGTVTAEVVENQRTFSSTGFATLVADSVSVAATGFWTVASGTVLTVSSATSPSFVTSGTITIEAGGLFLFGNNGFMSYDGGSIGGSGVLNLDSGAALYLNVDLTIDGLSIYLTDASLTGNAANHFTIGPASVLLLASTASNQAQVNTVVTNEGAILSSGPASFVSDSLYVAAGATVIVDGTDGGWLGTSDVENSGLIALTGSGDARFGPAGTTNRRIHNLPTGLIETVPDGTFNRIIDGELDNEGTILVTAPTVLRRQSIFGAPVAAQHVNSGTIQLFGGDLTVELGGTSPTFTNSGTVTVGDLATLSVVNLSDGFLTNDASGVINGTGTVNLAAGGGILGINNGSIAPGLSPGVLTWIGNVPMGPTGTLNFELEGITPGTGYDQLNVAAGLTLDGNGTLAVTAPGFTPTAGDRFAILTFASRTGAFDTVTLPSFAGVTLDTVWAEAGTTDTLFLVASAGPAAEWAWMYGSQSVNPAPVFGTKGVTSGSNFPGGREDAVSWIHPDGTVFLFGGAGTDITGAPGRLNDLWAFDGSNWTWIAGSNLVSQSGVYGALGVPDVSNVPGGRFEAAGWIDANGDLWLFGGAGWDEVGAIGALNDLWRFDGTDWTWMSGDKTAESAGVFGPKGFPDAANVPPGKEDAVGWIDAAGDFWVFGGDGVLGRTSDLWRYDGTNWTWMAGPATGNQVGVYGVKGQPSGANTPGARSAATGWTDAVGDLWLFGGAGYATTPGNQGVLNDLWHFDGASWTWISGSNGLNPLANYGTQGTPTGTNVPGSRATSVAWVDGNNDFWILGGNGYPGASTFGSLNDLWRFDGTNWTWMKGSNQISQSGVYGTQGFPDPANTPGGRAQANAWVDSNGAFWLMAGRGYAAAGTGPLFDMWRLQN